MKTIEKDMIEELNKMLKQEKAIFHIEQDEEGRCSLELNSTKFIGSFILNPLLGFLEFLDSFFNDRGIELAFNDTLTVFWRK